MIVSLMPNLTRDNAFDISKKICFQLDELNIKYIIDEKIAVFFTILRLIF